MLAAIKNQNLVLERYQHLKHFNQGDILPTTNDSIWLLKKGVAKTLTWSETGKIVTLGYWGKGDVIGLPLSTANPYEARCLQKIEAIQISWENCGVLLRSCTKKS